MGTIKSKKGVFFSLDALIALLLIFIIVIVAYPLISSERQPSELPRDVITVFSTLKISELSNAEAQALILSGAISDPNQSVLQQLGELSITNLSAAQSIANSILQNIETTENIGIWYDGVLLASNNHTSYENASYVDVARQIISGISGNSSNSSVTGFSARAFLSNSLRNEYFYFGGYVGDGDSISSRVEYTGNISSAIIEGVIRTDDDVFNITVNGANIGNFSSSINEFTPVMYNLSISDFNSGVNNITILGSNLHIAGGFIRVSYDSTIQYQNPTRYYFPGITGLVNVYDGFFIPGELNSLEISLHLNSTNFTAFLNIGNITVFNGTTNDEETILIDDTTLSGLIDYSEISNMTIPLRLGLENVSLISNITGSAEVFSITDLSGSMSGTKITEAISAGRLLIDAILNVSDNRIGLAGYSASSEYRYYHRLSRNNESLNDKLDTYPASGQTCICCGINEAIRGFLNTGEKNTSRVSQDSDDAEECVDNGDVIAFNVDLEFVEDDWHCGGGDESQLVGMRFQNLQVPQGANIMYAYLEFERDETNSGNTDITFFGEDTDDAPTFFEVDFNISGRTRTTASATWEDVRTWSSTNSKHQTPDLSEIIQEIVDRPGWTPGNSVAIIANGTGERTAEAHDSEPGNAPLLVVTYQPLSCGNGSVDPGEQCDDNNAINGDGCSTLCEIEADFRSIISMTDGDATRECHEQGVTLDLDGHSGADDAGDDAVQAACDAAAAGFTVHAVGFDVGVGSDAEDTMIAIASCGGGTYYSAGVGDLVDIYQNISQEIIDATFYEQTVNTSSGLSTELFSDSYIEFGYDAPSTPFGLLLTAETLFTDAYTGTFNLPSNSTPVETNVVSYSGPRWTNFVENNGVDIYDLDNYALNYIELGDPYSISIPSDQIASTNLINLTTGLSAGESQEGSTFNKIIYTVLKEASAFSPILSTSQGCDWTIQFEDDSIVSSPIPSTYTGGESCVYNSTYPSGQIFNNEDSLQVAVQILLQQLDFDSDGRIDVIFTEQDLQIDLTQITGIPFTWSTEVQVRVWR